MASNYDALLEAVKTKLEAIAPGRLVTRSFVEFDQRGDAALQAGVFSILPRGVMSYPYERSDTEGSIQTDLGWFGFVIVGQSRIAEGAPGVEIDEREFEMIAELEQLADQAIEDEELAELYIDEATMSGQVEAPYCWVATTWRIRTTEN
jgi:hypothetical protein